MTFAGRDTFLFDLDGTLIDSLPGIQTSFDYLLEKHFPDSGIASSTILKHVGLPLEGMMLNLANGDGAKASMLVEDYRDHNRQIIPTLPLFPGCIECLTMLRDRGYKVGLVTSKNRASTLISIHTHNLDQFLDLILTKDDTTEHKPLPGPLLQAMDTLKAPADKTVYVGDSIFDIQSAKAAGCLDVGALWGALEPKTLLAENPTVVLKSLAEIAGFLN
jgi:pyrophosphatase PpaX